MDYFLFRWICELGAVTNPICSVFIKNVHMSKATSDACIDTDTLANVHSQMHEIAWEYVHMQLHWANVRKFGIEYGKERSIGHGK